MLATVSVSAFGVTLLKRKDAEESVRFGRMSLLMQIANKLNRIASLSELPGFVEDLVRGLNEELGVSNQAWSRVFLTGGNREFLRAISDPQNSKPHLKQEIASFSCPAFHENRSFSLNDAEVDPPCPAEKFTFASHLCTPISGAGNESFGVVFVGSDWPNAFGSEERDFLSFIARSLGLAIQRLQRVDDLKKSLEMNSCATAAFMSSYRSLEVTLRSIVEGGIMLVGAEQASMLLWDPAKASLVTRESVGPHARIEWDLSFQIGEGIPGRCLESGELISTGEAASDPQYKAAEFPVRSFICVPMRNLKGDRLGVLTVSRFERREGFNRDDIEIIQTFAARSALALENAQIHQKRIVELSKLSGGDLRAA
jgi:GAF domain-containing protein